MLNVDLKQLNAQIDAFIVEIQRHHADTLCVGLITYGGKEGGFVTLVPLSESHPGKLASPMMHVNVPKCDHFDLVEFTIDAINEQCSHLNIPTTICSSDDTVRDCYYRYILEYYADELPLPENFPHGAFKGAADRFAEQKFEEASETERVE